MSESKSVGSQLEQTEIIFEPATRGGKLLESLDYADSTVAESTPHPGVVSGVSGCRSVRQSVAIEDTLEWGWGVGLIDRGLVATPVAGQTSLTTPPPILLP